jgi:hypothetical protein
VSPDEIGGIISVGIRVDHHKGSPLRPAVDSAEDTASHCIQGEFKISRVEADRPYSESTKERAIAWRRQTRQ